MWNHIKHLFQPQQYDTKDQLQKEEKRKNLENSQMWRLNNMLLNNQWVKEKIKRNQKMSWDKDRNRICQNSWNAAKAVLKGKLIQVINTYIKKKERSQINNLTLHLKKLKKEKQTKPKISKRKEITKIRVEINEID